jgi:hypothetical protein
MLRQEQERSQGSALGVLSDPGESGQQTMQSSGHRQKLVPVQQKPVGSRSHGPEEGGYEEGLGRFSTGLGKVRASGGSRRALKTVRIREATYR